MTMNAITKKESAVAVSSNEMLGMETGDWGEDIIQPRLKINQAMSPMVVEGEAAPGTLANSITNYVYGKEITIQPIKIFKNRIKWLDREDGGFDCRSTDGRIGDKYGDCMQCEFSKWTNGEPPECNAIINALGIVRDNENEEVNGELIIVSFIKTSYGEGRQLVSKILYTGKDVFFRKYKIATKSMKNEKGTFFIIKAGLGINVDPGEYADGLEKFKMMASMDVKVDYQDESVEYGDTLSDADKDKGVADGEQIDF
jgi:hypothetical protein